MSNVDTDMETTKQVSNIDTDTEGMILKADPVDTADRNHICFFAVFFMYMGKDRIFAYFKRSIVK